MRTRWLAGEAAPTPAGGLATWGAPVLVAIGVRIAGLGREPMWLDEILTWQFTGGTLDHLLRAVARDVHPPLYFLGVWLWRRLFGVTGAGLRGYGVIWSAVAVVALMLLIRELGAARRVALVAGFLLALSPLDIYYAQEARPYVQAGALAVVSTWLLAAWWRRRSAARSWPWLAAYSVTVAAMILTHYVTVTVALAQGLAVLFLLGRRKRLGEIAAFLGATALVAAIVAPWLLFVLRARAGIDLSRNLGWMPVPDVAGVWRLLAVVLPVGLVPVRWPVGLGVAVSVLVSMLAVLMWRAREEAPRGDLPAGILLAWLTVAPVAVAFAVSRVWTVVLFPPRFAELIVAFAAGWLALALSRLPARRVAAGVAVTLLAGLAWADAIQLERPQKWGMAGFARVWREHGPPDVVELFPRWARIVAQYDLGRPIDEVSLRELRRRLRGDRPLKIWACRVTKEWCRLTPEEMAEWRAVRALGRERRVASIDGLEILEITANPVPRTYPLLPPGRSLNAGSHEADPYLWSGWWQPEGSFRWSRGGRSVIVFGLADPGSAGTLEMEGFCYGEQPLETVLNGRTLGRWRCSGRRPQRWRWPVPPGVYRRENTLIIDHPGARSPAQRGRGEDRRTLALGLIRLSVR